MIKDTDFQKFMSITAEPQARDIAAKLNADGHKPRKAKKYNNDIVSRIIRGDQADDTAEFYIFKHYKEVLERKKELEELKRSLERETRYENDIEVQDPETVKP